MEYCKRCIMPTTRPGTRLNNEGICQACTNYSKRKSIDWSKKLKDLRLLLLQHNSEKQGEYACAIPVSGGKDSHYLVWLVKQFGINPLLIRVGDGFGISEAGRHNIKNLSDRFNCIIIEYTPSIAWYRKETRRCFEELGNFPFVDQLIYTIPYNICTQMKIPFLLYGEDPAYEFGTSDKEISATDYVAKQFVELKQKPIQGDRFVSVEFASHYVPWDGHYNYTIAIQYGFMDLEWNRKGTVENYDSIDSLGWQISNYLKFRKFGYGRATDILCRWIRSGLIDRDKAWEIAQIHDGELDEVIFNDFLKFTGYTYEEFWNIVDKWTNKDIFEKKNGVWIKK